MTLYNLVVVFLKISHWDAYIHRIYRIFNKAETEHLTKVSNNYTYKYNVPLSWYYDKYELEFQHFPRSLNCC